jgi:hypothetical protein
MCGRLLVAVVICSLTLSLATRFSAQAASQVHTVKSVDRRTVEPKRQNLHRHLSGWNVPLAATAFWKPVMLHLHVAQVESGFPSLLCDRSLYDRPPPSSLVL